MREQLIQYVELLFAGAPDSEDIKQEILQNTLDRFDDLVSQGKLPEAAYRLAISGIGDINEILGGMAQSTYTPTETARTTILAEEDTYKRKMRAVAIAMYILCPTPLFILSEFGMDTLGLCLTLGLVATATYLIMMIRQKDEKDERQDPEYIAPNRELRKSISNMISAIGLVVYFLISFTTQAWYITWLIFPIISCVKGLVNAILDLQEVNDYET